MYDLRLTPEQIEFRDTVRDFVEAEVKPVALHPDRLQASEKPLLDAVLDKAARIGLRTLALSEELGGAGADALTACIVLEEVAAGDPDIAMTLGTTAHLAHVLFDRLASPAQRTRFLPAFLDDDRAHLACIGEASDGAGWRYHDSAAPAQAPAVTAVRGTGGEWRLEGHVPFAPNAPIAKWLIVRAGTSEAPSAAHYVTALVSTTSPGLRIGPRPPGRGAQGGDEEVMPWYHGAGAAVTLDGCRVPAEYMLGETGDGQAQADRALTQIAAMNLGVGRAAFEAAVDYAKLRVQGGRPIIGHQSIGALLAESAIRLENARNMIWKAAWACDHPEAIADRSVGDLPLATMARVYAAEAVHEVTLAAAECFGAMGVMKDMPLQKYVHDGFVFLHGAGHDSASLLEVAERLAGIRRAA